jgi:HK97 family phage portal protein
MRFWQSIFEWIGGSTTQRNYGIQYPGPSYETAAAVPVTEETAMQVSTVWACVRLLSETVASLPLNVYRETPQGRVLDTEHWLAKLMEYGPNRYQTRVEFFETVMLNLALHGNAYCRVERIGGEPKALLPLMSAQVEPELLRDGSMVYTYTQDADRVVYSAQSVWHLKLYGNAVIGKSPLAFGRNIISIAQAADKTVTKIYQNGGKPSGVLSLDRLLTPEQRAAARQSFSSLTTGTDERLLVLEQGMKFDQISLSPQDMELLESRRFQNEEICRWFGVPAVMVNDTSSSTTWGSGIEQIVSGFYKLTLRPYLERIEASVFRHLLTDEDRENGISVEFDFEGLLRSDFRTRLEAYRTAVSGTIMTPNEVRRLEGLTDVEGGDALLSQVNMVPVDRLSDAVTPPITEEPTNGG